MQFILGTNTNFFPSNNSHNEHWPHYLNNSNTVARKIQSTFPSIPDLILKSVFLLIITSIKSVIWVGPKSEESISIKEVMNFILFLDKMILGRT